MNATADKRLLYLEAAGAVFIGTLAPVMHGLYDFFDGELIGILFGSVNESVWESCKTLLFAYLIWAVLESLLLRVSVRRFTSAKASALYALGAVYILLRQTGIEMHVAAAVSVIAALALSFLLYSSALPLQRVFAAALIMLFLFIALYFSLTPFAPENELFRDPETGLCGIPRRVAHYRGAVGFSG